MAPLSVVDGPGDPAPSGSEGFPPSHRHLRTVLTAILAGAAVFGFWIWASNADTREIRALPDQQRLALFHRLLDDLRNTCDPAPPRSLRDFCRRQADLALKFHECEGNATCQELARRHLAQPRR